MSEKRLDGPPPYDGATLEQMRRKHDAFVEKHACRLGVEPADILRAVRNYGHTAEDIAGAKDAICLTCYPTGGKPLPKFNVIGFVPVQQVHVTNHRGRR